MMAHTVLRRRNSGGVYRRIATGVLLLPVLYLLSMYGYQCTAINVLATGERDLTVVEPVGVAAEVGPASACCARGLRSDSDVRARVCVCVCVSRENC